jgi:hypothetical protein
MKTLHFNVRIHAPRERVWDTMLGQESYQRWTAVFCEGTYFEGSWNAGEKIRFLGPGGSGGMTSVIAENRRPEFVSIKHLGCVTNGVDDFESALARGWASAFENYSFSTEGEYTLLKIDVDTTPELESYMVDAWPKALALLKTECESRAPV